jgi:hypothetical protein
MDILGDSMLTLYRIFTKFMPAALIAGLLPTTLGAKDGPSTFRFGGMASIADPRGNLTDIIKPYAHKVPLAKRGFGFAIFGEYALNDKIAARVRLNYTKFGKNNFGYENVADSWVDGETNSRTQGFFGDFVYAFRSLDNGTYIFAGSSHTKCKLAMGIKWTALDSSEPLDSTSHSASISGMGLTVGIGNYITKNIGIEAKYMWGPSAIQIGPQSDLVINLIDKTRFEWLELSLVFRF